MAWLGVAYYLGICRRDDPIVHALVLHEFERHLKLRILVQLFP